MSATLAIVANASPPDRLSELRAERDALAGEYQALAEQRARIEAFESEEASIIAEIADISRREVDAIKAWAADPQGNPPEPFVKERSALATKLARAQAKSGAGRSAAADIEDRQREVHTRQLAHEPKIVGAIFDRIEAEFASKAEELSRKIAETRTLAADLAGLKQALAAQGRHLSDAGKIDEAQPLFARNERLVMPELLNTEPTQGEVQAAATRWQARANALRNGECNDH
jgi:hypothetical protein